MKNVKISKRLMSYLLAGMVFATPVAATSESKENENNNEQELSLVMPNKEISPMTMEEFKLGVQQAYAYLTQFIGYNNMPEDLNSLYYLVNRDYMDEDLDNELIANGIVYETDFANQKFETFARAYNLINVISEYNQSVMQKASGSIIDINKVHYDLYDLELLNTYLAKINGRNYNIIDAIYDYNEANEKFNEKIDLDDMCLGYDETIKESLAKLGADFDLKDAINEYNTKVVLGAYKQLIDPSELCSNNYDKELVHEMQINYIKAYLEGTIAENSYLELLFKQLTNLNAEEKAGNVSELSIGARFLAQNIEGNEFMQLIRDYLRNHYSDQELSEYFVLGELNKRQFILREDKALEYGCLKNDLEVAVWYFAQAWTYVYDHVNDDIMRSFDTNCTKSK